METGILLKHYASVVEEFLRRDVARTIREYALSEVAEPVLYSLQAGGKRIRPVLLLLSGGIPLDGSEDPLEVHASLEEYQRRALFAACSLEAIHTYSLIHYDLPAMDDDSMRRGKPSCHVAFSEWEAILAGDALNTLAFELLAEGVSPAEQESGVLLGKLVRLLARAAGIGGMVCGQVLDMDAEKRGSEELPLEERRSLLDRIHHSKTAAMMRASTEMGAVLAGVEDSSPFARYGEKLGLLFQITDDILDVERDSATLGKTAGKDARSGKLTYPHLYGLEESKKRASLLSEELATLAPELPIGTRQKRDYRSHLSRFPRLLEQRLH